MKYKLVVIALFLGLARGQAMESSTWFQSFVLKAMLNWPSYPIAFVLDKNHFNADHLLHFRVHLGSVMNRFQASGDTPVEKGSFAIVEETMFDKVKPQPEQEVWLVSHTLISKINVRLHHRVYGYEITAESGSRIFEHYHVKNKTVTRELAQWSESMELNEKEHISENLWDTRSNLSGIVIETSILPWNQYITLSELDQSGSVVSYGYPKDIFLHIQDILHFDFTERVPEDGFWGGVDANGSWNGIVGMLQRREIDLCFAGLSLTVERVGVIDFATSAFDNDPTVFWMAKSESEFLDVLAFFSIFSTMSWLLVGCTVTSLIIGFMLVAKVRNVDSVGNAIGQVLVIFLQRDLFKVEEGQGPTLAWQCLKLTSCFSAFLLFSFYSGALTSILTHRPAPLSLRSYQDIWDQGLDLAMVANTATETFVQNVNPDNILHRIYNERTLKKPHLKVERMDDIKSRMLSDRNILLVGPQSLLRGHPLFSMVPVPPLQKNDIVTYTFQKDSEFQDLFSHVLFKLNEMGAIHKLWRHSFERMRNAFQDESHDTSDETVQLDYLGLFFPFLVMMIGLVGSVILSVFEFVLK